MTELPSQKELLKERERRRAEAEALNLLPPGLKESVHRRRQLDLYFGRADAPPLSKIGGEASALEWLAAKGGAPTRTIWSPGDPLTDTQLEEIERCAADSVHWFNTWVWTYDPRVLSKGRSAWMPFDLYPRQVELVRWLDRLIAENEEGLCEKSRGVGFSWIAVGVGAHRWRFLDGFKTTFGSYVEDKVDKIGDADSIFEKLRLLVKRLPDWMKPRGYNLARDASYMRVINPENGNVVVGMVGENMGRGGRSSMTILDEAAFVPNAERAAAAVSENSDCRIFASTVNGMGNYFAKKRFEGQLAAWQIFRFHYRDDPRRDDAWAAKKKRSLAATPHLWASEFEIDYGASVEGIAIPAAWVDASIRLRNLLPPETLYARRGPKTAGLDIGAGKAKSVFVARFGPIIERPISWGQPDTIETANKALEFAIELGLDKLNYDAPGVGRGVTDAMARNDHKDVQVFAINTGNPPTETVWEDGGTSSEKFVNLKAEGWWMFREGLRCAYELCNFIEGRKDAPAAEHPLDECWILPDDNDVRMQVSLPKWFRSEKGKIQIETKIQLASRGVKSPDVADAIVLAIIPEPSIKEAGFFAMMQDQLKKREAERIHDLYRERIPDHVLREQA